MYPDHSGELIPIIARCSSGPYRPPRVARQSVAHLVPELLGLDQDAVQVEDDRLDHFPLRHRQSRHLRSLMSSAESALKVTGSPTRCGRAAARPRRARPTSTSPTKSVWSPAATSSTSRHSSQPSAPTRSGAPAAPSRLAIPCQSAIGGTPRAKCCASQSWPVGEQAEREAARLAQSSCIAACRSIATPTSGGSSDSETSEPTVRPELLALRVDRQHGDAVRESPHQIPEPGLHYGASRSTIQPSSPGR